MRRSERAGLKEQRRLFSFPLELMGSKADRGVIGAPGKGTIRVLLGARGENSEKSEHGDFRSPLIELSEDTLNKLVRRWARNDFPIGCLKFDEKSLSLPAREAGDQKNHGS